MRATATPRLDRTMKLADGRTLAYSEWGDLTGRPVVLLHGSPGSRLMCPDEDATKAAGVRLITIDRPGYGRSDPRPGRTVLDWVDDYVELADQLGLPPCPVVGWSGGGPYALACADRLADRVSAIGLAGAVGLIGQVPGARDDYAAKGKATFELIHGDRATAIDAIGRGLEWYEGDAWQTFFTRSWGDADDRLLARPDVLEAMKAWLREGARQGSIGWTWDEIAYGSPAGFAGSSIPRATLVSFPGAGHLFPFDHWGEMLAALS